LLAVWDKKSSKKVGGTAEIVKKWTDKKNLEIIDLADLLIKSSDPHSNLKPKIKISAKKTLKNKIDSRVIRTMLFSDMAGFSKLPEGLYPNFVKYFLKDIAKEINKFKPQPIFINTWGDAIFAVMSDKNAVAMMDYATCILNAVINAQKHLPQINIRIALHAGPVYEEQDPITKNPNYYGSHVNRAARIEPVTMLGTIYASEQFSALLSVQQAKALKYNCHYMGNISLAKNFDRQGTYKLLKKK
jgi:pilus assembly protein FimV